MPLISIISSSIRPDRKSHNVATDAVFSAIQKDVDNLLKPENKAKLANVLTYHVKCHLGEHLRIERCYPCD